MLMKFHFCIKGFNAMLTNLVMNNTQSYPF